MKSINTQLVERDDNWDTVAESPVRVLGWDRDKYFLVTGANGELRTTKGYHLSLKHSNQIHELPYIDWSEDELGIAPVTKKYAAKEIKDGYKRKVKYSVGDKEFNHLRKALNYIESGNAKGWGLHYSISCKSSGESGPLLVLEDGEWLYCEWTIPDDVSKKTLKGLDNPSTPH